MTKLVDTLGNEQRINILLRPAQDNARQMLHLKRTVKIASLNMNMF